MCSSDLRKSTGMLAELMSLYLVLTIAFLIALSILVLNSLLDFYNALSKLSLTVFWDRTRSKQ